MRRQQALGAACPGPRPARQQRPRRSPRSSRRHVRPPPPQTSGMTAVHCCAAMLCTGTSTRCPLRLPRRPPAGSPACMGCDAPRPAARPPMPPPHPTPLQPPAGLTETAAIRISQAVQDLSSPDVLEALQAAALLGTYSKISDAHRQHAERAGAIGPLLYQLRRGDDQARGDLGAAAAGGWAAACCAACGSRLARMQRS
jgi:hypothetical protein